MTEPSTPRPVPGPARPVPGEGATRQAAERGTPPATTEGEERFTALADRPVAEHVDVFEAEHDRLQAELGTVDRV